MKKYALFISFILAVVFSVKAKDDSLKTGKIEVSGAATVIITPDRITVEIGIEEYYKKKSANDSVKIPLSEIEKEVNAVLKSAGVADSLITLSDIGNYYSRSDNFLMTKRLSAVLTELWQLEKLSESLDIKGIYSFRISALDNSEIDKYNRQGLKAALDKAREKAEFIAGNEGVKLGCPLEISEDGPVYYEEAMATNVTLDSGGIMSRKMSMENMKKIVRRYNVKVIYSFTN